MSNPNPTPPPSDKVPASEPPDLNALLAREQSAIMRADAAVDIDDRDSARVIARDARAAIDLTSFPAREPHAFEALTPLPEGNSEIDALIRDADDMEHVLAVALAEGVVGIKHNSFAHRSRLIRQARNRIARMRSDLAGEGDAVGTHAGREDGE